MESGASQGQEASPRSTPSRASSPTWSGATARPIPWRCARSWRATAANQPCPDCGGTRLRREARHVKVGDGAQARAIYEVSHATLARRLTTSAPEAARRQGRDRRQGGARDRLAPAFLNDVGLNYLSLDRSADTLSRRRGAAHPPGQPDRLGPDRRDVRAGRAQHRPAPARQRPPARHAEAPARPRQHGAGGRARRGHAIRAADHVVDMGPGAGVHGGA
jgi:excinuclease ABC subunit A